MNTLKTIYDKIGKTELAKHEVELALIQELEKEYNTLSNGVKKMVSERKRILQEIQKYRETLVDHQNFLKLKQQYEEMSKELGVPFNDKYSKILVEYRDARIDYGNLLGVM